MEVGRFLVEAHLKEKGPVAELARQHGVHRSWLYKLIRRYKLEGESGVAPRSRRPHRSPTRIAASFEDEIVAIRKELTEHGFDAGATTIQSTFCERTAKRRCRRCRASGGSSGPGALSPRSPTSARRAPTLALSRRFRTRPGSPT